MIVVAVDSAADKSVGLSAYAMISPVHVAAIHSVELLDDWDSWQQQHGRSNSMIERHE